MNYNNKIITLLLITFAFILSFSNCFAEQGNQKGEKAGIIIPKNEDAVVNVECVKTETGFTVGFRVKIINLSKENPLIFVLHDNVSSLLLVRLINKKGKDVSPKPIIEAHKRGPNSPKKYKLKTIAPGASYVLFIAVPHQTRTDRSFSHKKNSQGHTVIYFKNLPGDLHTTPNGKYTVKIKVYLTYYMQDKDKKNILKYPKFKIYKLTLPDIPIRIDSKLFNLNIEKIYQETKK